MGLGRQRPNGTFEPITPYEGSWAQTVNRPISPEVRQAFNDRFAATHSQRLVIGTMTLQDYRRFKGLAPALPPTETLP
jgi:hypothetical protein